MPNRPIEFEMEKKLWKALATERKSRGITQVFVSEAMGISKASVSQLENYGIGHSLSRARDYSLNVLRCKLTIELPGGVTLTPIERTTEITRS